MLDTRLNSYRRARNLTYEALGAELGVKRQTANRYCLPKAAADHRRPGDLPSEQLKALTCGLIHAGNYAEEISEAEAVRMMAAIEVAERAQLEARHD
ncbi:MAG: hypothetical protein C0421_05840 [Hyphomonas sp.]|uniref:hypothetical protein n=1 Tax=Hyphomonas sp. TaxID=87 RepID=UPI0025BBF284|nr:hypothetical protein [Hyphomonas sp.]MBA4338348.1 hypothetical protein [Hyphomonas sp.]